MKITYTHDLDPNEFQPLLEVDDITDTHIDNIRVLRDWFLTTGGREGIEFNMAVFTYPRPSDFLKIDHFTHCQTVGCAAGHAPFAGIEKLSTETWNDYVERVFSQSVYNWLFSAAWAYFDNTIEGFVARASILLDHGLPLTSTFLHPDRDFIQTKPYTCKRLD